MKKRLLIVTLLLITSFTYSQVIERVEVKGKIIVKDNDIEGITVYNTTSEKGTITDIDGTFTIEAGLNDRIEISALQFKKFIVAVDEGIIEQRKMTIFMVEEVNKLPEVVVSPYDLSGNIVVDLNRVKTVNLPFKNSEFDVELAIIDLTPDNKTRAENPFVQGAQTSGYGQGGADVIALVGFLLKPLFKKKGKKSEIEKYNGRVQATTQNQEVLDLRLMYTNSFMSNAFGIPEGRVNEFIVFVEDNGLDYDLLKNGREMEFIDFLVRQGKSFLDLQSERD